MWHKDIVKLEKGEERETGGVQRGSGGLMPIE